MIEPQIEARRAATKGAADVRAHVTAVLTGGFLPDALVSHREFVDRVVALAEIITMSGVRAAAADALEGSTR